MPAAARGIHLEQARRVRERRAAGAAMLDVGRLAAGYGAEPVLKGIDLNVRQGEMVAVLGANGAGKSTLMRAIAGVHRPVEGGIALEGHEISREPAHRVVKRGAVLVPEGRQVFPELSVLDNLALGAYSRREWSGDEIASMLERFPRLRARLHQRAGLLSGGEQQMLAIARGLMAKPRLLLLDEPSLGAATILLVDQMAGLALSLADRAYVLEQGKIAEVEDLERAYLG